jgi:hypothetical protein
MVDAFELIARPEIIDVADAVEVIAWPEIVDVAVRPLVVTV